MNTADEIKEFIELRIEKVIQESMNEQKRLLKSHFDYCVNHAGKDSKFMWLRNELFGKD